MRALEPVTDGAVDRGDVDIHYEVFGAGHPTLLLIPPSPIIHSRMFKALIPTLARHYRVVTLDGRGNGQSGRPNRPESHTRAENVSDILAVLDQTGTDDAILVGHCHSNWWAIEAATRHPGRFRALIAIEPGVPYLGRSQPHWIQTGPIWDEILDDATGWDLNNRHSITTRHREWLEFFFDQQLVEDHSTKQFEDAVDWGLETTGEVLAAGEEGFEIDLPDRATVEDMCRGLALPTLTIHGELDVCQHVERGRAFAELTGGSYLEIEGAGHLALARDPVTVIGAIRGFVDKTTERSMSTTNWTRGMNRPRRALYLSSPIGLGHARRDVAIAKELRTVAPDLQIDWLAQDPVTQVLAHEGETIHPASEWLASESGHIASEAAGHDLHCFQALRRMDEILLANFMIFQEVIEETPYDLIIGDEAWDVDYYWHENPELKRGANVWLTDFVGYLPMPDGGDREAFLTADYNAEMIEHIARFPRIRDRALFVGNPDDVIPEVFGPDLPKIRDWTEDHFDFTGYITGFTPPTPDQTAEWRADLGYGVDEKVCVVTVGGSGVGRDLLEKAIAAYSMAREAMPELRMVAVAGPRIDPESLPSHPGLEVHGYIDRLYRHLSVCDLAVVQGGLTSTMELAAAKRPFLYFPLMHHFEQNYHVRHRLDQYKAGTYMDYSKTGPEELAEAIVANSSRTADYFDVETDGAKHAARLIAELI